MAYPEEERERIFDSICAEIAEGTPLREICRREEMPGFRTVYEWIEASPEKSARFARAREIGFDALAEEAIEIADDGTNDWMDARDEEGAVAGYKVNGEHIQRSKLRVETRLKLLAKWSPKKYGDKVTSEHTGPDGGPMQSEFRMVVDFVKPGELPA